MWRPLGIIGIILLTSFTTFCQVTNERSRMEYFSVATMEPERKIKERYTHNSLRVGIGFADLISFGGKMKVNRTIGIGVDVGFAPDLNLFNGRGWWNDAFPVQYWYTSASMYLQWHFAETGSSRSMLPQWYLKPMVQLVSEGESLSRQIAPFFFPTLRVGRELNMNWRSYFSIEFGVSYLPGGLFDYLPSAAVAFGRRI